LAGALPSAWEQPGCKTAARAQTAGSHNAHVTIGLPPAASSVSLRMLAIVSLAEFASDRRPAVLPNDYALIPRRLV